jgi:hypothetical protein
VKRRQKTAPLGPVFGSLSTTPQPVRLAALTFFSALVRQAPREPPRQNRCSRFRHPLSLKPPPPPPPLFLRGTYFGSISSVLKMDSSPSTLRIMARGIYRVVLPTGLRPRLPIHRRPLSSGVYSVFSQTHALSHERTTITIPPCPFSSTLDRTRVP